MIDWAQFTPWASLAGGAAIGIATALLILFNGRIAGISGIVGGLIGGLLKPKKGDLGWRIAFISGLIAAPMVWQLFSRLPMLQIDGSFTVMVLAGFIVGIGTRYGSGCTSGHGVCGLSRLSPRSVVATLVFMGTGFITVYIIRHIFQI
jgi:uncharacterized protein